MSFSRNPTNGDHIAGRVAPLPAPARRFIKQHCNQWSNTMTASIKNLLDNLTEAEINAGIDEAMAEAVRIGTIAPTGKMEWSDRRQCMIPVYKSLIYEPPPGEVEATGVKKTMMRRNLMTIDEQTVEEECITHDEDGYLVAQVQIADGSFTQQRLHELVCSTFHGPKPSESGVAIIIDKGLHPTARNVGWLTQDPKYAHR
jgi:hypothetical protein